MSLIHNKQATKPILLPPYYDGMKIALPFLDEI